MALTIDEKVLIETTLLRNVEHVLRSKFNFKGQDILNLKNELKRLHLFCEEVNPHPKIDPEIDDEAD